MHVSSKVAQWSPYIGAMATKTNYTEDEFSSIMSHPFKSFYGVVVSTSVSHSENRGSILCQGIFPFFQCFQKRSMFVALCSLWVKSGKDETLEI